MIQRIVAKLRAKKHVVWDWNGTLLDDVDVAIDCVNSIRIELGLEDLNIESYRQHFGFPVRNYYTKIGFPDDDETFRFVSDRFIERYEQYRKNAVLHMAHVDLMHCLASQGLRHSILSASRQDLLLKQVDDYGILHHFDHAFGIDNHYAASKVARGRELIDAVGIDAELMILFGDTDHDLEVGSELGLDVVLLSSGHQDHSRLAEKHDLVLSREDFPDLLSILGSKS